MIGVAVGYNLVASGAASFTLAVTSITMALIPLLATVAQAARVRASSAASRSIPDCCSCRPSTPKAAPSWSAMAASGRWCASMLEEHRFPFLSRPTAIRPPSPSYRRRGREVYYGDAANPAFLEAAA